MDDTTCEDFLTEWSLVSEERKRLVTDFLRSNFEGMTFREIESCLSSCGLPTIVVTELALVICEILSEPYDSYIVLPWR